MPQIFLTSGTVWIVPPDWSPIGATIESIGPGGNGSTNGGFGGGGGQGGGYGKVTGPGNVNVGDALAIQLGTHGSTNPTWLKNNGGTIIAQGDYGASGSAGTGGSRAQTNIGAAGTAAGGSGGNGGVSSNGGGGGGGAGPRGAGGAGANNIVSFGGGGGGSSGGTAGASASGGDNDIGVGHGAVLGGGPGGAGSDPSGLGHSAGGGAGGAHGSPGPGQKGGNGGSGQEFDATHGSGAGGGGGGGTSTTAATGGDGGTAGSYGGGGGGAGGGPSGHPGAPGAGGDGLIVITYTPLRTGTGRTLAYLAEISAYDIGGAVLKTLLYCASARGGYSDPSAPGYYEPRIVALPTFRRDIFGNSTTGGPTTVSFGDLILANNDGGLDAFRGFGLAGQACALLIGDPDGDYRGFTKLIYGRIQQALFDEKELHIQLYDRLQDLQVPLNQTLYLGTNALPSGVEGVDDLLGRPKPMAFGSVANVSPPCVNTSRLEYQVNNGAVADVPNAYDAGAALTKGADYVSQVDMETNAPAAGNYRVWKAGGYFRLGSSPAGTITADVTEGSAAADRTAAQIAKRILTGTNGISAGDVNSSDVATLDGLNSAVVGIYIDQTMTFAAALDQILQSVGAWYGFDRLGQFRMRRLDSPN